MKRTIVLLLAVAMASLVAVAASAETIQIDLSTATDDELRNAIDMIEAEQVARYMNALDSRIIAADEDGIAFRGIPWFSTLKDAEESIGQVSTYRYADDLRRLSYIDFGSITSGKDRVDGDLGCAIDYPGLNVAGYTPSSTIACYIFPVVDGQIVREFDLAELYMGYYTFENEDFGDFQSMYGDLTDKLNQLYGEGQSASDENFTNCIWRDQGGNYVRIQLNASNTYMTLAYVAADADQRLDEMAEAYDMEHARQEDTIRQENVDNTDGL